MAWTIEFAETALRQLARLDRAAGKRIRKFLQERVASSENPRRIGEALHGQRVGELWKYRIGDYRLITRIEDNCLVVLVVKVGHRRDVYR